MMEAVSRESLTLDRILAKARESGIKQYKLERVAGLSPGYLSQAQHRTEAVQPATLASLALALDRMRHNRDCDESERARLIDMVLRVLTVLICEIEGADAEAVNAQDPKLRATQSADWLAAAQVRQTVMGLASSALGLTGAQLAIAAGMTRAGVKHRLNAHEDRRDNPEFDTLMERLESAIRGGL